MVPTVLSALVLPLLVIPESFALAVSETVGIAAVRNKAAVTAEAARLKKFNAIIHLHKKTDNIRIEFSIMILHHLL
jgi:hypothetical protein